MQPRETITPGTQGEQAPQPAPPTSDAQPPVIQSPAPQTSETKATPEPQSNWQYQSDVQSESQESNNELQSSVSWTASEYIAHEKGLSWFMMLGLAVAVAGLLVFLITQELLSTIVIVVIGIAFGIFAARPPQELQYAIDDKGIHIGQKSYFYSQFKSFTIVEEGPIHSIMLMPLQRFMPPLSVYFAPDDEDRIADTLSNYLPYEQRKQDYIDRIMRKVRF